MKTYTEQEVRDIVTVFALKHATDRVTWAKNKTVLSYTKDYLDNYFNQKPVTVSLITDEEHIAASKRYNKATHGIVVFYQPDYNNHTIKEIGRTGVLTIQEAFDVYANTANPASQMIKFSTVDEMHQDIKYLNKCITDKEWLDNLFDQI